MAPPRRERLGAARRLQGWKLKAVKGVVAVVMAFVTPAIGWWVPHQLDSWFPEPPAAVVEHADPATSAGPRCGQFDCVFFRCGPMYPTYTFPVPATSSR